MNVFGSDDIYSIDPVDAKSFDEFVRQSSCKNCIATNQAWPLAPRKQYCWAFESCCRFIWLCFWTHYLNVWTILIGTLRSFSTFTLLLHLNNSLLSSIITCYGLHFHKLTQWLQQNFHNFNMLHYEWTKSSPITQDHYDTTIFHASLI